MNPLTIEWIEKAEGDYATAGLQSRVRRNPNKMKRSVFMHSKWPKSISRLFCKNMGLFFLESTAAGVVSTDRCNA